MTSKLVKKVKKLNRIEKALLTLAEHISLLPHCEYDVEREIADILGLTRVKKV